MLSYGMLYHIILYYTYRCMYAYIYIYIYIHIHIIMYLLSSLSLYIYIYIIDGNMYNLPLYTVAQGRSGRYSVSG